MYRGPATTSGRLPRPPHQDRQRSGEPPWTRKSLRSTGRPMTFTGRRGSLPIYGKAAKRCPGRPSRRRWEGTAAWHQPTEVHTGHDHPEQEPGQPGRPRRPGVGYRPARSRLDLRHHLSAHRAGLGVFVCRPRWMLPTGNRVGDGRPHAHRTRHRGIEYGRGIPRAAAAQSCLPRRPRHARRIQLVVATPPSRRWVWAGQQVG